MTGTVLLVSEDAEAGILWADALARARVEVSVTGSIRDALRGWREDRVDLIVLDVCDDWQTGLELCRHLRAGGPGPILVLCPHDDEAHAVAAYRAGADECIDKRVSPAVLFAKIRAWLRHRREIRADLVLSLEAGGLRLEPACREVHLAGGAAVRLSALELRVLYLLMSNPGQVFTADAMLARVWGSSGGDRSLVKRTVHRLRKKIEPDPARPQTIRTVRGHGYAFAA